MPFEMPQPRAGQSADERLERLVRFQRRLCAVAREIGPAVELEPVLDTVLRAMRDLLDFKGGSICLVEGDEIRLVVSDPPVSEEVRALRLRRDEGLSGHIVTTGEPLRIADIRDDPRTAAAGVGSNATIRAYIGVPLTVLGEVIGLLQVDSAEPDAFTNDDLAMLEGLGTQVAGAIESARRYEAVLELDRMKAEFMQRVSHELRTPLAILDGFIATLLEHDGEYDAEERRTYLERIWRAASRLRYLVDEVVTLSRLDGGAPLAGPEPVDVAAVCAAAVAKTTAAPEDVEQDVPAGLQVRTDGSILGRVLAPVLDNAVKYAGTATLRARATDEGVVIEVRDRGEGLPPEVRSRAFQRFTRGRHTVEGLGLGLPIARHLADAIAAELVIDDLGPGTCVTIRVPDL